MKLKSLRLFGFKTFAEQTTLHFEAGVVGIVGPNGSGKSNLVDAIRWVLGEQSSRSLRAGKTEDVIFAGNERRKPLGMAEVAITFDNAERRLRVDAAEVQLTRRAYRAGESEFYINREQARLRDVLELLMGTGLGPGSYAIVSQGQIDAVLSSKPTERRSLFEETAGINRFLARKNEALRRLEQTEQNGIRINDVLAELTVRIPDLETQARRARRFRKASERLRDLEVLSYLRASGSRRAEHERLQVDLQRLEAECAAAGGEAATLEANLSTLRTRLYAHDRVLEEARDAVTALRARLADAESKLAVQSARRDALEALSSQITDSRERVIAERAELEATVVRLNAEIAPNTDALQVLRDRERQAHEATAAAREVVDRIFTELRELEARSASAAATDAERRAQLHAARGDFERLGRELNELREGVREKGEALTARMRDAERAGAQTRELDAQVSLTEQAASRAHARVEQAHNTLAKVQGALRLTSSEIAGTEARLHTIEELEASLEGHVPGTRAVLEANARGELFGIEGVVSKLISVDEAHARALDIAFGGALSNIITVSAEDAERAITYLSGFELGRATFLPLDVLGSRTGRSEQPPEKGVIGYAHTLVNTRSEYSGIVAFLVGRILIVETLEVGVRLVRGQGFGDTVVTLDGDEIRGGGAMTGGRHRRERSLLSRAAQARSLREKLPRLKATLICLEDEALAATQESTVAARERDETGRLVSEQSSASREAHARVETLAQERMRLESEVCAMLERSQERVTESERVSARLAGLERPSDDPFVAREGRERLETALAAARASIVGAEEAERAITTRISALRETAATLTAQRDGAHARLAILSHDHERAAQAREAMRAEIAMLVEGIAEDQASCCGLRTRVHEADIASENARTKRERMTANASESEASLRIARLSERNTTQSGDKARLRLAEVDAELGMLAAQFAQNPATAHECADIQMRYAEQTEDLSGDIGRLREEISRFQNVNLNAEAEIEELVERERFLKEQLDDLARAKETLIAGIAEIERQSHEQFNLTFEKVRAAFSAAYAKMFPGGEAKMWKTQGEQLSEIGIEISVQPPGKKMMGLASLSGGERAMTSAALIFALIAVKPSPFYLLDEVDAALDDANISRFSQTVREMAKEAQMLIVTHNRQTMESTDRMYGVTMTEPGISNIIAANLSSMDAADSAQELEESEQRVVSV